MAKRFRIPAFGVATVVALALFGGSASAQVTIGQVAPTTPEFGFCDLSYDEFQLSVGSGASYTVPLPGGLLTSWSTNAGPGPGQKLTMKVFRPQPGGGYQVVAHDGPRALTPSALNTFPLSTPIPVLPNDIVGIHVVETLLSPVACTFDTTSSLDLGGWREGDQPDGGIFTLEETETEFRYNVAATLLPPPLVTGPTPGSASINGGTPIVITGANFAYVKSVTFGTTPVTFSVDSESQITALSPSSATLTPVPITVTTAAGAGKSIGTFFYEGCEVPKLKGKKLKASKRTLRKLDCKLGKVRKKGDVTAKAGKVIKQSRKPGTILAPGTKVSIKLG